jgi:hypothetical protein
MKCWAMMSILALASLLALAGAPPTVAHAMSVGAASLSAAYSSRTDDRLLTLVATSRHSSAAAILTCNKIHKRSEREKCLGNMRQH